MNTRAILTIGTVAALFNIPGNGHAQNGIPFVDLLFTNATVYTGNAAQPQAQAIAVRSNQIVFVGPNADAAPYSRAMRVMFLDNAQQMIARLIPGPRSEDEESALLLGANRSIQLIEFYAAVARKDATGFSGDGWHPEEAVSREDALKMFTSWAAYAAFQENDRGIIAPGKLADFTVLTRDIMKIPEKEILTTERSMTVIDGEIVFERGL